MTMNTKNRITLELVPDSSFLLGGVSVNPAYHSATALDENNLPFLTATALKGALRMEFEAFAWGTEEIAICDLDKNDFRGCGQCLSCRLFGGNNNEGKLRFNAALLKKEDMQALKAVSKDILDKGRREGVSISRTLGKARDKSYFSTLTFPDLKGSREISFTTHLDVVRPLDDNEHRYLEAFFAFLEKTGFFMGSRKSVGLGYFKINCQIPAAFEEPDKIDTENRELKLFRVTLITEEPLVVGDVKNQYIIDTLPYLPASTMGGSIGFGFVKNGIAEDVVSRLFLDHHSFTPFNFYWKEPFPNPVSMRAKKGEKDREKDILISDFIIKRAIEKGKFAAVEPLFHTVYRSSLRPAPVCKKPDTTYQTKVAIGRVLQKGRDGMLYSMELIPKDKVFQGLVIGEAWTGDALKKMELFIGGKRTRGFGKTEIEKVEEISMNELLNRDVSIDAQLRKTAKEYGIDMDENREYFALDLLADLEIPKGKTLEKVLKQELFGDLDMEIEKAYPHLIRRGGYDFTAKKEKPLVQKVGAGSVFLVSVPKEKADAFRDKAASMLKNSILYKWDSTPLFMLNNPKHTDIWR